MLFKGRLHVVFQHLSYWAGAVYSLCSSGGMFHNFIQIGKAISFTGIFVVLEDVNCFFLFVIPIVVCCCGLWLL